MRNEKRRDPLRRGPRSGFGTPGFSRREFVRTTASLAAGAIALSCGSEHPAASRARRTLKILQWSHFVPGYDEWFDRHYTKEWGARHDTEVIVDHMASTEVNARGAAEAAARKGHDLFLFLSPPAAYEDQVVDLREVLEEVEKKHGAALPLAVRSTRNPKTGKFFAFSDSYVPDPGNYRTDLWSEAGYPSGPDTWEDLRIGGARIKARFGNPVGIGMSQETDSNMALRALLWSFGGAEQDEQGRVAINSKETIEALRFARALYRETMTPEIFTWDPSSNNRMMLAGRGSYVQNAISVTRTAEKQDRAMAGRIGLVPALAGPVRRIAAEHIMNCWVIWSFAENVEGAKSFLVDFVDHFSEAFRESEFYNLPCFPSTVPNLSEEVGSDPKAEPPGKYRLLATALDWTTNIGYPGYATAASDEIFNAYLIPTLFARVARGEATPEEGARAAEAEARRISERRSR